MPSPSRCDLDLVDHRAAESSARLCIEKGLQDLAGRVNAVRELGDTP